MSFTSTINQSIIETQVLKELATKEKSNSRQQKSQFDAIVKQIVPPLSSLELLMHITWTSVNRIFIIAMLRQQVIRK